MTPAAPAPSTEAHLLSAPVFDSWLAAARDRHIDPYTVWSLRTGFRQFNYLDQVPRVLDFLVELVAPIGDGAPPWAAWNVDHRIEVPGVYASPLPGVQTTARHITVRLSVDPDDLQAASDAVARLILDPAVCRAQIGFPRPNRPYSKDSAFPHIGLPSPPSGLPPAVLLGVLEDGCPFGHAALASPARRTRVVALWDQTAVPAGCDDPAPPGLGYGRERRQSELDALMSCHAEADGGVDEAALYADPRSLQEPLPTQASHAAAIVTLFAGRKPVLPWHSTPLSTADPDEPALPSPGAAAFNVDDAAAGAPLVVVQFPREQVEVAGARWLVVRALDGLRYLAEASTRLGGSPSQPLPLVVNISYGSLAGAHDGTALIETAMAELASAHQRLAIVLAAGNSYGVGRASDSDGDDTVRLPSGRHAAHQLPSGSRSILRLHIPPNKSIETYLEIWFDDLDLDVDAEQFLRPSDAVSVRLTSPLGAVLECQRFPDIAFDGRTPRDTQAGVLCLSRVAQSQRRSLALVVVSATQISTTRVAVPSGVWTVEVTNAGARRLRIEAWVERDLIQGPVSRSQAARLLPADRSDTDAVRLNDDNTLNNLATGAAVFRVGALVAADARGAPQVSAYSSAAGPGRPGPELSAVADESPAAPGIRASGVCSGSVVRINGTSVAAPQAARWIANRLAAGASLAEVRAEIAAATQGSARRGRLGV